MTRIYVDCEFLEDGRTIDLISIGLAVEDGSEYYAINRDAPARRIQQHPWLMAHVVPHLPQSCDRKRPRAQPKSWLCDYTDPRVKRRALIAAEVRDFILSVPDRELWAWYGAYDHVVLCQLWGSMTALPDGIPMWTNDLQQEAVRLGNPPLPPQESGLHNALHDARHNRTVGEYLRTLEAP